MPSQNVMNISTLLISLFWWTAATVQQAAEVRRCLALLLQTNTEPDGNGTMCLAKSSLRIYARLGKGEPSKAKAAGKKTAKAGKNADMEIRPLTQAER